MNWPLPVPALQAIAVAVAVAGLIFWADGNGYQRAEARCVAEMAEMERANRRAIADAEERLRRVSDELSVRNMEREDVLRQIEEAASSQRDADRICLSGPSVDRLRSIR